MAVPESSIVPYPGLLLDSSTARSIVESIVEVVSPSTKAIPVLATTQEKLNEPASTVKDLAIATTPSSTMAAVEETLGPLYAAAQEKAAPVVSAINGSIAPMFQRPHTTEHLPADHDEKMAEPGYPIKDLSSLTGPAPVVASAQATIAPAIASVTDRVAPMVASAEEALGPAVHAAQEKLAPVIAALQNAANVAVAMVTETPTAVVSTKDTLAAPVEDVRPLLIRRLSLFLITYLVNHSQPLRPQMEHSCMDLRCLRQQNLMVSIIRSRRQNRSGS